MRSAPTGAPNLRAWFLYEFLIGRALNIPDATGASFTDLLDDSRYFTAAPRLSRRHKVRDSLLGTPAFCPIIRRTQALTDFDARALAAFCRRTAVPASRSKAKSRRATGLSGGGARYCRPEKTR